MRLYFPSRRTRAKGATAARIGSKNLQDPHPMTLSRLLLRAGQLRDARECLQVLEKTQLGTSFRAWIERLFVVCTYRTH